MKTQNIVLISFVILSLGFLSFVLKNKSPKKVLLLGGLDNRSGDLDINSLSITSVTASAGFNIGGTSITSTATELNKLDGATVTTAEINRLDGVTATNATHLKTMNQSVSTTSNVTFNQVKITKTQLTDGDFGSELTTEGQSFSITINNIPELAAKTDGGFGGKTINSVVSNASVLNSSVVLQMKVIVYLVVVLQFLILLYSNICQHQ